MFSLSFSAVYSRVCFNRNSQTAVLFYAFLSTKSIPYLSVPLDAPIAKNFGLIRVDTRTGEYVTRAKE